MKTCVLTAIRTFGDNVQGSLDCMHHRDFSFYFLFTHPEFTLNPTNAPYADGLVQLYYHL